MQELSSGVYNLLKHSATVQWMDVSIPQVFHNITQKALLHASINIWTDAVIYDKLTINE